MLVHINLLNLKFVDIFIFSPAVCMQLISSLWYYSVLWRHFNIRFWSKWL